MIKILADLFLLIALLGCGTSIVLMLLRDLMMMQQNSYRYDRFRAWMSQSGESTTVPRLAAIMIVLFGLSSFVSPLLLVGAMAVYGVSVSISLWRRTYKKPLVFTPRACRIFAVACVLALILPVVLFFVGFNGIRTGLGGFCYGLTACCAVSYVFIIVANWILIPVQRSIDRKYRREAEAILSSMPDLKIIGITGSYGKTSTKHFLYAILSEQFQTTMTPGNFNTTLGVIRTVREHLKPYTEVFIVEMGAKQKDDIKDICDLVHPQMGIITAVGPQHLESFKTLENVRDTKFELADSLLSSGLIVLNNDFPMIATREVGNCRSVRYALDNHDPADYHVTDIAYTPRGTSFALSRGGEKVIELHTRLLGSANISDLAAAIIIALEMGMTDSQIRYAVERIEPVEHRLSIKHTPGGVTILDDAYNSNPVGSAMALEVLSHMKQGRRIVITPGMIELGADQERLNREFGSKIAGAVDIAVVVGQYNREAILAGISEGEGDPQIIIVDTFAEGQHYLNSIMRPGDTILYENDLPDTFK